MKRTRPREAKYFSIKSRELAVKVTNLITVTALVALCIYSAYLCVILAQYIAEGATFPVTHLGEYTSFVSTSIITLAVLIAIALLSTIIRRVLQQH